MMQLHPTNHHPQYPYQVEVPPWSPSSSPNSPHDLDLHSPSSLFALSRFLPSNNPYGDDPFDDASSDEFRMYEFKVRRCTRGRSHDWTECPYAHPGEKARRRDPRKYLYSGAACPDFRKGSCKKGDACDLSHGVFECWLHPSRYRTQPCKDGINCRRRVCFFAHTPEQLRVVPSGNQNSPRTAVDSYDGSPARHHHNHHLQPSLEAFFPKSLLTSSSPTSTLMSPPISPPSASPPLSPSQPVIRRSPIQCGSHVDDVLNSFRQLRIGSWASPRGGAVVGSGFSSLPGSSRSVGCGGLFDLWEGPVERVESGRDLRAKIAEKLSKENCVKRSDEGSPDVAWVSDLVN